MKVGRGKQAGEQVAGCLTSSLTGDPAGAGIVDVGATLQRGFGGHGVAGWVRRSSLLSTAVETCPLNPLASLPACQSLQHRPGSAGAPPQGALSKWPGPGAQCP